MSETQNKPQLFKEGRRLPADSAIADPSLTMVEVEDAQGFLLAESCYEDALGQFHLETVLWVRLGHPIFDDLESRSFADVKLYRMDDGNFVAQAMESGKVIPHPSSQPFCVAFLSEQEYQQLKDAIVSGDMATLELAGRKIKELPGFSFDGDYISAPKNYCVADMIKDITQFEDI